MILLDTSAVVALAARLALPFDFLLCEAAEDVVRERLRARAADAGSMTEGPSSRDGPSIDRRQAAGYSSRAAASITSDSSTCLVTSKVRLRMPSL